jgi:glycogen synthase
MVEDGVSGYLVEPENPQKLAAAIRRHFIELGNPDLSEGIEQMNHRLSWDNYSSRLETFIDQLIAARYQVG